MSHAVVGMYFYCNSFIVWNSDLTGFPPVLVFASSCNPRWTSMLFFFNLKLAYFYITILISRCLCKSRGLDLSHTLARQRSAGAEWGCTPGWGLFTGVHCSPCPELFPPWGKKSKHCHTSKYLLLATPTAERRGKCFFNSFTVAIKNKKMREK